MKRHSNQGTVTQAPVKQCQDGLTLVELMIAISLGLLVVMAATSLLLSAKSGYVAQSEGAYVQDSGRYAIETITRAIRQAAYENWDQTDAPIVNADPLGAYIIGLDASSLRATTPGIASPVARSVNGSDVLAVRFFGAGSGANGDGTMMNCAGFGVPAVASPEPAADELGWSIFYVAQDTGGEPELYCKFKGSAGWSSQAIVRGVESFQVLYGIDTDGDSLPNRLLNATAINALDDALPLQGADAEERAYDKDKRSHWKKVVLVKVALLIRGAEATRSDALTTGYDLFGRDYADAHAALDLGTRISEKALPAADRNRIRKIFTATILLRNQPLGNMA
jgi:type IV pilus assembly protein PilW